MRGEGCSGGILWYGGCASVVSVEVPICGLEAISRIGAREWAVEWYGMNGQGKSRGESFGKNGGG